MKVSVNDLELFTLSEIQQTIIEYSIDSDLVDQECSRRLQWIILELQKQSMKQMRAEWIPKLKLRVESIPLDDEAFAQLVFSQEDYMDRKARDLAAQGQ